MARITVGNNFVKFYVTGNNKVPATSQKVAPRRNKYFVIKLLKYYF